MTGWVGPRGHEIAVLFSGRSRDAYATEAAARGETYTFTDAWGRPRTWLKGEFAYLAPNAASPTSPTSGSAGIVPSSFRTRLTWLARPTRASSIGCATAIVA